MDITIRLEGLARFLTTVYGEKTDLPAMLGEMGFESEQVRLLREECLPAVAEGFVGVVRKTLTSGDKDLWFRLLNRRYGLDGEPPMSLEEAAFALAVEPGYASQAQHDALEKCCYKKTQDEFRRELHRLALDILSSSGGVPEKQQVVNKLKRLADLHAALDMTRIDYEAKRAEVLKKVQAELDALESEYQPVLDAAQENASTLEAEIKNDVLLGGESVKTDLYQAIYVRGRISWDTDGMDRYARSHPEVLAFRREGEPNVSIRKGH